MRSITPAAHLVGGWYDIFLREIIADYQALRASGQSPYLTIGPWNHLDPEAVWEALRQGITWFDAHLKGDRRPLRTRPVRIYVMGKNEWCEMGSWPPPNTQTSFFARLQSGKLKELSCPLQQAAPGIHGTTLLAYLFLEELCSASMPGRARTAPWRSRQTC
jgi:predicted acyl esterase